MVVAAQEQRKISGKKPKRDWINCNQADVAACLGVSLSSVEAWARTGMPGSRGKYSVPDIVAWLRSAGPWRAKVESDDPLLASDGESAGLERYRLAKAAIAELDLEERKGTLLSCEKAKGMLLRWASVIRRLGERLGKRYGTDAAIAVNDALSECGRICDELGSSEPTDVSAEG